MEAENRGLRSRLAEEVAAFDAFRRAEENSDGYRKELLSQVRHQGYRIAILITTKHGAVRPAPIGEQGAGAAGGEVEGQG